MISPAKRIDNVKEYYFSMKLKQIAQMNAEGKNVLNLGIGDPDMPPSEETIEALCKNAKLETVHGYQSYIGIPQLRQAFADFYKKWYGVELNATNEIQPMIGSKEAITHISLAFINPGDIVLVPDPGYPTYSSVSELTGATIRKYNLKYENNWEPDFNEIENMGLEGVKLMWVNYPNMPTGRAASKELLEKLVAFGKKNNILIVNDNPYSFILNDAPLSILSVEGAKDICIELNSLSKSHNMAGWRVGVAISNPIYISYILRVKSNVDSGMFKPLQLAASQALKADVDWYKKINETYKKRKLIAFEILDLLGCTYDTTQTGMFVWAKHPETGKTTEEFAENILQKADVFITPGFIFGQNGEGFLRISLCSSEEMLKKAYDRIRKNIL